MDLRDKVALVTGAAGGLGSATARALAARGAIVVATDIDAGAGSALAAEVGGHFIACDVADLEANRAAAAFAVDTCGGIDLAFLNAGVSTGCGVGEDFDLELYRRANGANLDGVVFGTHAVLPALRARGGGAIVATASLAGLVPVPLDPIYCANKHAVVGFGRAMADALAHEQIRVNVICPGFAESGIIAPFRQALIESGFAIIPARAVADAVVGLFEGEETGSAVVIQSGREPLPYQFRNVPGPRPLPE